MVQLDVLAVASGLTRFSAGTAFACLASHLPYITHLRYIFVILLALYACMSEQCMVNASNVNISGRSRVGGGATVHSGLSVKTISDTESSVLCNVICVPSVWCGYTQLP